MAALLGVVAWDACGADLAVTRLFGNADGFRWRDAWWASHLLHDGGRALGLGVLLLLAVDALRPFVPGPDRRERALWWLAIVASALAVPALKRLSRTSCPWDLAEFGGHARYVPHWLPGAVDGGPGHCFPSGHAVSAFALIGLYFLWRDHRPRAARALLTAVLLLGALFGAVQTARGAHHVSHTLWSAWLCAAMAMLWAGAMQSHRHRRGSGVKLEATAPGRAPPPSPPVPAERPLSAQPP